MDKFGDGAVAIMAGASGLVGNELLKLMLGHNSVKKIYALVRHPLELTSDKLIQKQNENLTITDWNENDVVPDIGYICLGTTIKQAGSKQALEKVDFELVCRVAREMKLIGVKRIAVVSSLGANAKSLSHYLRCKGRMEQTIINMVFERMVFVRPGPLAGNRKIPRGDEVVIQKILHLLNPVMCGYLANFRPIQAADVAKVMLFSSTEPIHELSPSYTIYNSREMIELLNSY